MQQACKAGSLLLIAALAVGLARGQDAPQVDLTDPQAVAEAYVKACLEGDLETALPLMAADDPIRQVAGTFVEEFRRGMEGEGFTLTQFMTEFLFVPMKLELAYEMGETQQRDGEAEISVRRRLELDQRLHLAQAEDGTWRVKVLDSLRATTGARKSFLAQEIGGGGRSGPDVWRSQANLRALQRAMEEYAQEHGQRLPSADRWVDEIEPYLLDRSVLQCPAAPELEWGYAMNAEASGADTTDRGALHDLLLLFEWPSGERNALAMPEELAATQSFRPNGSIACVAASGSMLVLPQGMAFADVRAAEQLRSECEGHLRALGKAARKFARDHDGMLPSADNWQDELALYLLEAGGGEEVFTCPAAPDVDIAYAVNRDLAGKQATELTGHDRLVLFFESDLNTPNAVGAPAADTPEQARHFREWDGQPGNNIVYLSGSTTSQAAAEPAPEE